MFLHFVNTHLAALTHILYVSVAWCLGWSKATGVCAIYKNQLTYVFYSKNEKSTLQKKTSAFIK